MAEDRERPAGGAKGKRVAVALLLAALVVAALLLRGHVDGAAVRRWLDNAGWWGPLAFMAAYAAATVAFFPGSVLTLAGGALFGPLSGTIYSLTGATIGATGAFVMARYLASDWVARRSGGRLARLMEGVEAEGWRFVAFVRLVPLFPFNLLNFALGLTRIRLLHYVIASYIAMLPGALAYSYLGYVGREALGGGSGLVEKGLLALALLVSAAFLPRFLMRLRRGR